VCFSKGTLHQQQHQQNVFTVQVSAAELVVARFRDFDLVFEINLHRLKTKLPTNCCALNFNNNTFDFVPFPAFSNQLFVDGYS